MVYIASARLSRLTPAADNFEILAEMSSAKDLS